MFQEMLKTNSLQEEMMYIRNLDLRKEKNIKEELSKIKIKTFIFHSFNSSNK